MSSPPRPAFTLATREAPEHDQRCPPTSEQQGSLNTKRDTSSSTGRAPDLDTIRDRIEALGREVLDLPCEILIPPERHDNRQKYAMYAVLDYVLGMIDSDCGSKATLAETIKDINARSREEIERDAAEGAGLSAPSEASIEIPIRNLRGVANIIAWGQGGTLGDNALELLADNVERAVNEIEAAARRASA